MANVTQDRLKELVHYDPASGVFTRIKDAGPNAKAGTVLGKSKPKGRSRVCIDGKFYLLHRLAFLYMTGAMPENEVDHINRDPSDNRWENLRPATRSENCRNIGVPSHSTSGLKGASFDKARNLWQAGIKVNGRRIALGRYKTAEEAHAAYVKAAEKYFGEFAAAA